MEVMVAVLLLSVCLVVIFQLFAGGLRTNRLANDYSRAVFHAKEKMEEVFLTINVSEGDYKGEFDDGYKWQIIIKYANPDDLVDPGLTVDLFDIHVIISWSLGLHEKKFQISSLRAIEKITNYNE